MPVDHTAKSAPPAAAPSFRSGVAIGVAATAVFAVLGPRDGAYFEAAAFISGISLMVAGLVHLKRGSERAAAGVKPAYWRGCLFVALGAASIAVPAVHSMLSWGDMCGGDQACIESFRR